MKKQGERMKSSGLPPRGFRRPATDKHIVTMFGVAPKSDVAFWDLLPRRRNNG